ncbi:hydroxyphenylacetyl-CoA thioesterase PaaI [uncultured Serinicoccus sp.]|uniref:hydroxyphenylacetyl-CoA thioesterase PaaI n=1 Tax=uncultured Serinicoccus sp. TaxID=735514 RepID=UPI002633BDE7|nr:hydroxyphenylacetyl-CoA thioesterase PaaI [uncultured Serinicoccus sp.]
MTPPDLTHVRRMWEQDRASAALGIELLDLDVETADSGRRLGRARTRMTITDTMVNGHAIAHGGYVFTLADSTFALACNATGRTTVAASCDITYLLPSHLDDVLVATARERVTYGRSGITDVTVCRATDNAVVAEFRGHSRTVRPTS